MKIDQFNLYSESETESAIVDAFNNRLGDFGGGSIVTGAVSFFYKDPESDTVYHTTVSGTSQSQLESNFANELSNIYDPDRIIITGTTTIIE